MLIDVGKGNNKVKLSLEVNLPRETYLLSPHNTTGEFSNNLTHEQLTRLKNNKAFLIILETLEPVLWEETKAKLNNLLEDLPHQNIIILSANYLYNYNKTCPYKVFFFNLYWGIMIDRYKNLEPTFRHPVRHFQFLSKTYKVQRSYFFYLMYINDLLEKGYVSHLNIKEKTSEGFYQSDDQLLNTIIKNVKNYDEYSSITNKIYKLDDSVFLDRGLRLLNFDIAVDVINETSIAKNHLFLSEKIIKTIIQKNMFLVLGNPYSLKLLKKYGFKTFETVFDESYDSIICPFVRINKVFGELHKFCKLSLEEIAKIKYNSKDIIEYNYNHLMNNFDFTFNIKNIIESYCLKIHKENENGRN